VFALILETLSSTELLFILVIALIFFGPRKLPQFARTIGKGLAEFRKASDDFKRTWEREVAMETAKLEMESENTLQQTGEPQPLLEEKTVPLMEIGAQPLVAAADPEFVVARGSVPEPISPSPEPITPPTEAIATDPLRKQEWI
jgi:sec-independent protein translocase protein TatA